MIADNEAQIYLQLPERIHILCFSLVHAIIRFPGAL